MERENVIKEFFKILKEDTDYKRAWKDNIAMAFQDAYHHLKEKEDIHTIANHAADAFLSLLLEKRCDWMEDIEKLYYLQNPGTRMDVPSFAYETGEKWYRQWQGIDTELSFYDWCLENKKEK